MRRRAAGGAGVCRLSGVGTKDCADGSGIDRFEWDETLYEPVPGLVYHF